MRHLFVLLATFLAVVTALPLSVEKTREILFITEENTRNNAMEQLLLDLIENVRELMINGSETIPPLDPLEINHLHVDESTIDIIPGYVTINDMTVSKMSTFEINELSMTMTSLLLQRYRLIIDGSVPEVDVDVGGYDLELNVFGGRIFGTGDAEIKIVQPRIRGNILMGIILDNGLFLRMLECEIRVSIESFEPHITGMFNNPVLSEFVSTFLRELVAELLEFFEEEITEIISTTVLEVGNEILADLNLADFLE